jgi:hypothetical protein
MSSKALLPSYQVLYRIAQNKKLHMIADTVILPAATDMIQCLVKIVLSSFITYRYQRTVFQRIADISEDLVEQLIEKLRNKCFSIQIDKATDCSAIGHLIAYA